MADSSIDVTPGTGATVDFRTESTNSHERQVIVIGDPSDNDGVCPVDGTAGVKVDLGADNDVTTELPAAAALADNTSNPTAPAVASFGHVWDGATWDRTPGTSADGVTVNLGSNNDVTNSTIEAGYATEGSALGSGVLIQGDDGTDRKNINVDATTGDVQVDVTNTVTEANSTAILADTANMDTNLGTIAGWDNAVGDGASVSGDIGHDSADAGEPIKTGGKAFDFAPSEGTDPGQTAVAANDRVNQAYHLDGRVVERVYCTYHDLDNINVSYNTVDESNTSQAINCENYREGNFFADVTETGTATTIRFIIEASADGGTTYEDYVYGHWGSLMYDDQTINDAPSNTLKIVVPFTVAWSHMKIRVDTDGPDRDWET